MSRRPSGWIEVLLRPNTDVTTVFQIRVVPKSIKSFPRIWAWFSVICGRPFSISPDDLSIHESCIELRIRGYFDGTLQIHFDRPDFSDAIEKFTTGQNGFTVGSLRAADLAFSDDKFEIKNRWL